MRSLVPFLAVLLSGRLLAAEFWVSPSGKDSNPGTKALPFATLERARGASRAARGGTVWIRAGTYRLERGLALGAEDSGVAYRAAPGEEARLSGAIPVREADARKATDPAVLARLDPAARRRVVEIDAAGLGLRHVARFPDNFGDGGGIVQIYFEGRRLPLARWPNRGYSRMVRVTDMGDWSKDPTRRGGSFLYEGDRPERWGKAIQEGLWLDGFWRVPWTPEKVRVASIDAAKKQIVHAVPVNGGIASKYARPNGSGQEPWCAVNVLEEIDTPGEWSLDFRARKIYLWPPAAVRDGSIRIADSDGALLSLRGASRVAITGIVFEGGLGNGIEIEGGADNRVAGCTFRNLGGTGAVVNGGLRHGIESCDFHGLGQGGVSLSGGDRARLTPSGHFVVNSHFHHLGEVKKTYTPAVNLAYSGRTAVGMRIAHNLIHDLPHAAVLYAGNDHVIELNEVHNVALDSGDVGAFYTWNDWTSRGNIVRHNFVHHSTAANAFYMDDGDSGDTVEGNVVYRTQYGPFIGGGHDNTVRNNLVIEARNGLHMDARGVPRRYDVTDRHKMNLLGSIDWRNPPWSTRYPDLLRILERPELPVGNLLADNALVGCGQPLHLEKPAKDGDDRLRFSTVRNNIVVAATAEAGFVDAGRLDFRLRPDSPLAVKLPRLKDIPFERIGLYRDQHRKTLPDPVATGRYTDRRQDAAFDSDTDRKASDRK